MGDELSTTDKSVGIYVENSKVTNDTTGVITVGEKGIAFLVTILNYLLKEQLIWAMVEYKLME